MGYNLNSHKIFWLHVPLKNNKDKMQQIEIEGTHIFFGICQVLQLKFSQSIWQ